MASGRAIAETLRRSLADWLTDMGLVSAGSMAEADGYVGYMEPYATSHEALDEDRAFQQEAVNAARALGNAVRLARAGRLDNPAARDWSSRTHLEAWTREIADQRQHGTTGEAPIERFRRAERRR
jgi:hypothetical protein